MRRMPRTQEWRPSWISTARDAPPRLLDDRRRFRGAAARRSQKHCRRKRSWAACSPPFLDELRCRAPSDARHTPEVNESGRFGLDLMDVISGCTVDGDPPRLHGLGDFPDQLDLEQAVVE